MPPDRIATESDALIGVSGRVNVSEAPPFSAPAAVDDASVLELCGIEVLGEAELA